MTDTIRDVIVLGASSGIGAACVAQFRQQGWRVLACQRNTQYGVIQLDGVSTIVLDVTDDSCVRAAAGAAIEWAADAGGPLGVVNAVGLGSVVPVELMSNAEYLSLFQTNVFGPMVFIQALMPALRQRGAKVIHLGSTSGRIPAPLTGGYGATKAALDMLVASQRLELAGSGVQVTLLQPGVVTTQHWRKLRIAEQALADRLTVPGDGRYRRLLCRRASFEPITRGMEPASVARRIAALLKTMRLRPRYYCGTDAHAKLLLWRILPDICFEMLQLRRTR